MTFKKLIPALLFAASSFTAIANPVETTVAVVAGNNANTFKLVYKAAAAGRVQVAIVNSHNEIVFRETLNNMDKFTRPYNFDGLPEGEYTIEVTDGQGKRIEKLVYGAVKEKGLMKVTKLSNEQAKYLVTVASKGSNIINITILDAEGNQIFQDGHITEGNFGVVYNLGKNGTYTFMVTDKSGDTQLFMN